MLLVPFLGCENENDPTAPADSTIIVSADPATVVVDPNAGTAGVSIITATLLSKNGTRIPDYEVVFTTSQGTLDPPAQTQLKTNDHGFVTSELSTTQTATVTARSGNITQTTTVQVTTAAVSQITLNVSNNSFTNCSDPITVTARVLTSGGLPVSGLAVAFFHNDPPSLHTGLFDDDVVVSDSAGEAVTEWRPNPASCLDDCSVASGMGDCNPVEIQAGDSPDRNILSNVITLIDDID